MAVFFHRFPYAFIAFLCWTIFGPYNFSFALDENCNKAEFQQYDHVINIKGMESSDVKFILGESKESDLSLYDMISALPGSEWILQFENTNTSYDNALQILKTFTLPFKKLISDGEYRINNYNSSVKFDDIVLLEEEYLRKYFCNPFHNSFFLSPEVEDRICKCQNSYSNIEITPNDSSNYYSNFCPTKPCNGNECIFRVNPWIKSLILISSNSDGIAEKNKIAMAYRELVPEWTYLIKNIKSFLYSLKDISTSGTKTKASEEDITSSSFILTFLLDILDSLEMFLAYIPHYLGNLLFGFILLAFSEDIARNQYLQMFVVGSLGVASAIVVVLFLIYRFFEKMFKSFSEGAFGIAASLSAYVFTSSIMTYYEKIYRETIIFAFKLWDEGLFGYTWIMKAYYFLSFLLFAWASAYFKWFVPVITDNEEGAKDTVDTIYFKILSKFIAFVGIYHFYNGSSNHLLTILMLFYVLTQEEISDYYRVIKVNIGGYFSKSPEYYFGKRLTLEEYDKLGDDYTQKELNKLKILIQNNDREKQKVFRIYEDKGASFQSKKMTEFINGSYPGRPIKEKKDDNVDIEKPKSWLQTFVYNVVVIFVIFYLFIAIERIKVTGTYY